MFSSQLFIIVHRAITSLNIKDTKTRPSIIIVSDRIAYHKYFYFFVFF